MISNTLSNINKKSMNNLEKIIDKIAPTRDRCASVVNNLSSILSTLDKLKDRKRKIELEFNTAQMSDDTNTMNKKRAIINKLQ